MRQSATVRLGDVLSYEASRQSALLGLLSFSPVRGKIQADRCFELLKSEPRHPSLHFKRIGRFWSARVGLRFRALAVEGVGDDLIWVWIGSHADYDQLLRSKA